MAKELRTVSNDICGVTQVTNGKEWVCVRPPHSPVYRRRKSDKTHKAGDTVEGTGGHQDGPKRGYSAPPADRHYYVNRWPNREEK